MFTNINKYSYLIKLVIIKNCLYTLNSLKVLKL